MKHEIIVELERVVGVIGKCDWCNIWKPMIDMRTSKIFGTSMCKNCFYNFCKIADREETSSELLNWLLYKKGYPVCGKPLDDSYRLNISGL